MVTRFSISLTGTHARAESTIQATQDWERGRISSSALGAAFKKDCDDLVALQQDVDTEYISDGQFTAHWQDFLRPITNGFSGLKKGAMVRWYNTNTFYYEPVVHGAVSTKGQAIWSKLERRFAKTKKLRVAVPDPLTFAELAVDSYYADKRRGNRDTLLFAYADALNSELRTLDKNGVAYLQFSSPALVARFRDKPVSKDQLSQLGEAVRTAKKGTSFRTGFHTFFGDASPYLPGLFDVIPTDDLGLDFTQTDPEKLSPTKKGIIAGVADARSTYLEEVEDLSDKVEAIVERTGSPKVTLAPSSDLRYIPRVSADEKLRRLGALRAELISEGEGR